MTLPVVSVSSEALRRLPTSARPRVDQAEVVVPDGYDVDVVLVGLSMPTGMAFADDGALYVLEGGSTWPPRPYLPARILRLDPAGGLGVFHDEVPGYPRGVAVHAGFLYVAVKDGCHSRIVRYDLSTGELTEVVDGLPDGGWHGPGGPVFGPDGLMYFAQGSVSQNGVVLPRDHAADLARYPLAHDVPGQDVALTGNNIDTYDPTGPYPAMARTGAFKPFGVPAEPGEVVKGVLKCSTGVWRSHPDGREMELLAWGVRNPYGMAFNEDGDLYVSDNDFEETGERAIANDPDRIWLIRNARSPHGTVGAPDWYGFPDICADGVPVWDSKHLPQRGRPAQRLIAEPPVWAGPPVFFEMPHSAMAQMDFCRSDAFGQRGRLFVCEWGTLAPMTSPRPQDRDHGFKVISVDVARGTAEEFVRNRRPGPASANRTGGNGTGGIERPIDCAFAPDGRSLYVLDFGVSRVDESTHLSFGHTGVLWRVTRR